MNGVKNFFRPRRTSLGLAIKHKSEGWLKFLISAVALLFLLAVLNIFASPIKNAFYTISSPIQKTLWVAGESLSSFIGSLFNAGSLAKENKDLKKENQKLLSQLAFFHSLEQQNQAEASFSASCLNSGFKFVMAGVTGLDGDIFSINKGSQDGILEGMPVVSQQNVLFGKILNVYKNFSRVMLVSSKNSIVNVKVQQGDNPPAGGPEIDGVVKGSGGLTAYLDLIPIDSTIRPNDVLVTSAIDKLFPRDLLVGEIVQIQKDDQKPFQQAQVNLFLDIKNADNLFVITNYKQTK